MEQYQITNALNLSESTYDGNLKMVSDRAKRDRSPRGAEERSDGAPSSQSSEARSPPRHDRAKRGSTQLATERSKGANTQLKLGP